MGCLKVRNWQELEELTRIALEAYGYECEFRKVFKSSSRRYEIDLVARKQGLTLAFDCKHYVRTKSRSSALKREAKKHFHRCQEYSKIFDEKAVPILLTYLDDALFYAEGCIFVPLPALNDFLLECSHYLELFFKANLSVEVSGRALP